MSESSEQLLQSLRDEPEGLTLSSLLERHPNVARRTAQRWLARLVQQDRIAAFGRGRARRYALAEQQPADDPSRIPLTTASREVLAQIEQPIPARQPVGYREAFLLDYRPNETFYLPTPLRERLRGMGLLPQDQMPIAGTYGRELVERLLIDLSMGIQPVGGQHLRAVGSPALDRGGQCGHRTGCRRDADDPEPQGRHRTPSGERRRHRLRPLHGAQPAQPALRKPVAESEGRRPPARAHGGNRVERLPPAGRPRQSGAAVRHPAAESRGHRGSVRTVVLRIGASALLAALRGREQAHVPTRREHAVDPRRPLPADIPRRSAGGLRSGRAWRLRADPHRVCCAISMFGHTSVPRGSTSLSDKALPNPRGSAWPTETSSSRPCAKQSCSRRSIHSTPCARLSKKACQTPTKKTFDSSFRTSCSACTTACLPAMA